MGVASRTSGRGTAQQQAWPALPNLLSSVVRVKSIKATVSYRSGNAGRGLAHCRRGCAHQCARLRADGRGFAHWWACLVCLVRVCEYLAVFVFELFCVSWYPFPF